MRGNYYLCVFFWCCKKFLVLSKNSGNSVPENMSIIIKTDTKLRTTLIYDYPFVITLIVGTSTLPPDN